MRHDGGHLDEAVRYVAKGEHQIHVECEGGISVETLVREGDSGTHPLGARVPSADQCYGRYDMAFLKKDVLPNITTLIIPQSIALPQSVINGWHRQGKRFVVEVGIDAQAKTADEHCKYWTALLEKLPFTDGMIQRVHRQQPCGTTGDDD